MQPGEVPQEPTTRGETLADIVGRFVVSFVRNVRTLQLYPSEHRYVHESFDQLAENLHAMLDIRPEVTFGFREDAVLFDDQVLLRGNPTVATLRRHFDEKGIESITVDREVRLEELRALARMLAKHRADVMKEGRVDRSLLADLRAIRVNEVSYRRVEQDEVVRQRDEPERTTSSNPFLSLDSPRGSRQGDLSRLIAESPGAMTTALLEVLRSTIEDFDIPAADVERPFLALLERISLAVLDDPSADLDGLRESIGMVLRPLVPNLLNRRLHRLVTAEMDHDVFRAIPRFTLGGRARMLLTEALRHAESPQRVRRALEILGPSREQAEELLTHARDTLSRSTLAPRRQRDISSLLEGLSTPEAEPKPVGGLVVVAETDPRSSGLIRLVLEQVGYSVLVCGDGASALESVLSARPKVFVLDPALPGIHGLEILARLKRSRPCVPVILATSHEGFREDFAVSTYPHIEFLPKPIDRDQLIDATQRLVGERERPTSPLGPDSVFQHLPAEGPTYGFLRTATLEVGVCARGRFRDTFFRILPFDEHRSGVFVAEREAGPPETKGLFRMIGLTLEKGRSEFQGPADVLGAVDRALHQSTLDGTLISGLALEIDDRDGVMKMSRAGYTAPLVASVDGAPAELHLPFGPLLGARSTGSLDGTLREARLPFPVGTSILLHSSGALKALCREDADVAGRLFSGFLRENAGRASVDVMESLLGLLGGLGVCGPGADLQVLLVRRLVTGP
jgi:CheY-like chemotaxis protein